MLNCTRFLCLSLRWKQKANGSDMPDSIFLLPVHALSSIFCETSWCVTLYDIFNILHILSPSWFVQGYFLLRFLADQVGERQFIRFFRSFVEKYHGQLVLSQVSQSCGRPPVVQLKQQNISVGDPQLLERLLMNSQNKRGDSEAPFSFP